MTTPVEPRIDVVRIDPPETPGDVVHSYLPVKPASVATLAQRLRDSGAARTAAQIEWRYVLHPPYWWPRRASRLARLVGERCGPVAPKRLLPTNAIPPNGFRASA